VHLSKPCCGVWKARHGCVSCTILLMHSYFMPCICLLMWHVLGDCLVCGSLSGGKALVKHLRNTQLVCGAPIVLLKTRLDVILTYSLDVSGPRC
jgi:hypothetical protein